LALKQRWGHAMGANSKKKIGNKNIKEANSLLHPQISFLVTQFFL